MGFLDGDLAYALGAYLGSGIKQRMENKSLKDAIAATMQPQIDQQNLTQQLSDKLGDGLLLVKSSQQPSNLENYLKTIVFIRNICAHNDLLYDSNTAKEIETTPMIIFNNNNRHSLDSSIKVILYFLGQVSANRRNEVQKEIDIIFREHQSNPIISTILTEKSNYRF